MIDGIIEILAYIPIVIGLLIGGHVVWELYHDFQEYADENHRDKKVQNHPRIKPIAPPTFTAARMARSPKIAEIQKNFETIDRTGEKFDPLDYVKTRFRHFVDNNFGFKNSPRLNNSDLALTSYGSSKIQSPVSNIQDRPITSCSSFFSHGPETAENFGHKYVQATPEFLEKVEECTLDKIQRDSLSSYEDEIETGEISPGHVQRMKSAFESPRPEIDQWHGLKDGAGHENRRKSNSISLENPRNMSRFSKSLKSTDAYSKNLETAEKFAKKYVNQDDGPDFFNDKSSDRPSTRSRSTTFSHPTPQEDLTTTLQEAKTMGSYRARAYSALGTNSDVQFDDAWAKNGSKNQKFSRFEASKIVQEANQLQEEACQKIEQTELELQEAQKAQEEATKKAEIANQITLQALNKEVEGKEKLVTAGHKLMEAGAKLQQEAAQVGRGRQAVISIHQKGQIRQEIRTEMPKVPPPGQIRVKQARQLFECRPIRITEEKRHFETHGGPQASY